MQRDSANLPDQPSGLSFPRALRLRRNADIRRVMEQGRRAAGERVLVVALPNDAGHLRFASIVGRKVSKKAHERNRLRRRLREAFRTRRAELEASGNGWDLVVVPLRREGAITFSRLAEDLVQTAQRARRTRSKPRSSSGDAPRTRT